MTACLLLLGGGKLLMCMVMVEDWQDIGNLMRLLLCHVGSPAACHGKLSGVGKVARLEAGKPFVAMRVLPSLPCRGQTIRSWAQNEFINTTINLC